MTRKLKVTRKMFKCKSESVRTVLGKGCRSLVIPVILQVAASAHILRKYLSSPADPVVRFATPSGARSGVLTIPYCWR